MPLATPSRSRVPSRATIPLTILESLRQLDAPDHDGVEEFHPELTLKRLGMSETVAAQIERYQRLGRTGRVDHAEVVALFRLVGRRHDAGLVFAHAGRQVGRKAVGSALGGLIAALPAFARRSLGFLYARRAARRVLGATMLWEGGRVAATIADPPSAESSANGAACSFYGSALAEILRSLIEFDGALYHVQCRSRGDAVCSWRAAVSPTE